jgi:ABC-type sugar transport system substrate-binding protein
MMKKSFIVVAIMLCLMLLVACSTPAANNGGGATTEAPATEAPSGGDGAAAGDLTKIGFIHYEQSWEMYQVMEKSIQEECDRDGVQLVTSDARTDAMKNLQQIETMMNSGVQAIVCVTVDGQVVEDVVKQCTSKGIPYLSMYVPVESATVNMSVDEYDYGYQIGKMGADYMAANFPGEAIEVALLRMHDYEPGIERGKGMEQALADIFPSGVVVNDQHSIDLESAMSATEAVLAANPNVRLFLTDSDDTGAIGAYEVLKTKVDPADYDKYCVIGADGVPKAFELIKEHGMYRGTVALDNVQIGKDVYKILSDAFYGKALEKEQFCAYVPVDYDMAMASY